VDEHTDETPRASPTWAAGARRLHVAFEGVAVGGFHALLADDSARRRLGWSHAALPPEAFAEGVSTSLDAVFFSFDFEDFHGFWMRDIGFDLELFYVDSAGIVVAVHQLVAGSIEFVYPPIPIRYALELPAGDAAVLGVKVGDRLLFDPSEATATVPFHEPEPPVAIDPQDDPSLISRWSGREHFYSSHRFAAAAALMGWRMRVGPEGIAIWLHAGGGYVLHPPLCPLAPLQAFTRALGLAWLRLELVPSSRLVLPDGRVLVEQFDPANPDDWLARMRGYGLYPTAGRWQQTRTLLVDLTGPADSLVARLPPRIRYEVRAFERSLAAGVYRVEVVPAAAFDQRQQRAFDALHSGWLAAHPEAEDNDAFCRPMAHGYGEALTAYLCWQGSTLVAVQLHVLWQGTLYYLFSETIVGAPQGLTPGLIFHGVRHAKTTPFGAHSDSPVAPDVLDLVGSFDPRYPFFRAFGKGFTTSKLRWHPTNVWLPPSVAFAGMEIPL